METAEATMEMPEATVETAEPESGEAVKAMVAVKNGHVAAKVDCSSEEWVTLAAHNLEARCAPFAIEHSPFCLLLVHSAPSRGGGRGSHGACGGEGRRGSV